MNLPNRTHIHSKDAPWVVLVNGLFTGQDSWDQCLEYFTGFNILTYDGKGQGDGPGLEKCYSLDEQVSDLFGLLKFLDLKKVSLVGLSNGGRVALKFASLYPEKVKSLVACDTYAELTPILKLKLESWLKAHHRGGALHRFDVAAPWVWGESILKENPELIEHYRKLSSQSSSSNITSLIEGAMSGDVELNAISSPVCFVVGEEDLLTPVFHHQKLATKIKDSRLYVVPGGHASILEYPETFKSTVLPFLRGQNGMD